jgi:hypothetical protein
MAMRQFQSGVGGLGASVTVPLSITATGNANELVKATSLFQFVGNPG